MPSPTHPPTHTNGEQVGTTNLGRRPFLASVDWGTELPPVSPHFSLVYVQDAVNEKGNSKMPPNPKKDVTPMPHRWEGRVWNSLCVWCLT